MDSIAAQPAAQSYSDIAQGFVAGLAGTALADLQGSVGGGASTKPAPNVASKANVALSSNGVKYAAIAAGVLLLMVVAVKVLKRKG